MFLSRRPALRLVTLCALYVAQGIPFGFVTIALVATLAKRDVSATDIATVTAMTSLPWAFKWAWGPIVDAAGVRPMGRRRPWILGAQTGMVLTLAGMLFLPDLATHTSALAAAIFLHNVFASLQDVSTDALAVDLLPERERGVANGLMYGSSYFGTFVGGAGMGWISLKFGLDAALGAQMLLLVAIMMFPLWCRERPGDALWPGRGSTAASADTPVGGTGAALREAIREFGRGVREAVRSGSSGAVAAVYAFALKIPAGIVSVVPLLLATRTLGWTEEQYVALGSGGVWFGLAGSVLGGFLASAFGARRIAVIGSLVLAGVWFAFALSERAWPHKAFLTGYVFAETFLVGLVAVASFALFMGVATPRIAATQFTAYMAMLNLSQTAGIKLAGWIEPRWSTTTVYLAIAAFQVLTAGLLIWVRPRRPGADHHQGDHPHPVAESLPDPGLRPEMATGPLDPGSEGLDDERAADRTGR